MKNGRKYRPQEKYQKDLSHGILVGKIISTIFLLIISVNRKCQLALALDMVNLVCLFRKQDQMARLLVQIPKNGQDLRYMEM